MVLRRWGEEKAEWGLMIRLSVSTRSLYLAHFSMLFILVFYLAFFKKCITYLFFFYQHWNFVCL